MASSLIGGLIADGIEGDRLHAADPSEEQLQRLTNHFGIQTSADNAALAGAVDVVVLAVKPQGMRTVCEHIAPAVQARRPLIISVAAGVRLGDIERWLGGNLAVVRTMPNTPALVRSGATALCANPRVNSTQRELAEAIMRAVGLTLWVADESQIDAVTALSGSGPAYFFLVMEALERAGTELGLDAETARLLTLQTAFGAAKMALESRESTTELRTRVTSPGGTTERAIGVLTEGQLEALFARALTAARDRAGELAELIGGQ